MSAALGSEFLDNQSPRRSGNRIREVKCLPLLEVEVVSEKDTTEVDTL
jgi:hypothetical protein